MRTLGLRLDREELILEEIPLEPPSLWSTFLLNWRSFGKLILEDIPLEPMSLRSTFLPIWGIICGANPRGNPSRTPVPLECLLADFCQILANKRLKTVGKARYRPGKNLPLHSRYPPAPDNPFRGTQ